MRVHKIEKLAKYRKGMDIQKVVSRIKARKQPKREKRPALHVVPPPELYARYKKALEELDLTITDAIIDYMLDFVESHENKKSKEKK